MAKLHIIFDTDTGTFVGASLSGTFLHGVASVTLGTGTVSVRDYKGQDLLAPQGRPEVPTEPSKAAADIAAAFGATSADGDGR